ncbi:MAG TPA: hypothetical protein VFS08_10590 [Gemmatimonadaceae bacterium]|nr:hypothetical protein [Gemmatimonadaceae bacterium]
MDPRRRPVAIAEAASPDGNGGMRVLTVVACDDGSVWFLPASDGGAWHEMPPIPGSVAAAEPLRAA